MKLNPTTHNYFTAADESPSTLLHRLHTNEKQLRALAVVLSLTGGLALSFALGVGIMIYWYCRKCKKKRNTRTMHDDDTNDSEDDDEKSYSTEYSCSIRNCHYFYDTNQQEPIVNNNQSMTVHSSSNTLQEISSVVSQNNDSLHDLLLLPQPPISAIATPEPSAPSAKELHFQVNADATSSTNNHQELEQELCHDCSIPPPAYTKE